MPRTDLPVTKIVRAGHDLAADLPTPAAADGHAFVNNGRRMIRVRNVNAAARTVTVQIPGEIEGQPIPDVPYMVPADDGDVLIPPLPAIYNQANGKVYLDYSDPAGLTVDVLELPAG
ncbi:hypothetical protein [Nonomuraea rhizosphaerae]|uniref:hypothetical protein n=1 Tax=Nonomuraea rhizosphaerae TaxID=2665663 RepID=UPI001C5E043C|nr:hypothetical protein [Nonomuraea rhizosphaerae]